MAPEGCADPGSKVPWNRERSQAECQHWRARLRWLQARERELLPTPYVHAVFTLPRELAPLGLQNKRLPSGGFSESSCPIGCASLARLLVLVPIWEALLLCGCPK